MGVFRSGSGGAVGRNNLNVSEDGKQQCVLNDNGEMGEEKGSIL